eukprot:m.268229 g.268229  ORF g.268229 m.268229 type:complete len:123 (-) comp54723_c4_seq36:1315-1683(-)
MDWKWYRLTIQTWLERKRIQCTPRVSFVFAINAVFLSRACDFRPCMNISAQNAFICNQERHWFTIRKIGNTWYNLNSLNKAAERISDTYLSLFLAQLTAEGLSQQRWNPFFALNAVSPSARV